MSLLSSTVRVYRFTPSTHVFLFLFECYGDHRDLHSFPTRRSSDLNEDCLSRAIGLGLSLCITAITMAYLDRKSTRLNSSHRCISYAVFCLKKKKAARTP